jgi:hypothetical protein
MFCTEFWPELRCDKSAQSVIMGGYAVDEICKKKLDVSSSQDCDLISLPP